MILNITDYPVISHAVRPKSQQITRTMAYQTGEDWWIAGLDYEKLKYSAAYRFIKIFHVFFCVNRELKLSKSFSSMPHFFINSSMETVFNVPSQFVSWMWQLILKYAHLRL